MGYKDKSKYVPIEELPWAERGSYRPTDGMRLSNRQLDILLPVVQREYEADRTNPEWCDLYERLLGMKQWRERVYAPAENPLPKKVWGRDYV